MTKRRRPIGPRKSAFSEAYIRSGPCPTPFYDHPGGLYRMAGSDRTYTHNELVEALEGDVSGLDFEQWAESYLQLREYILAAGAAGFITIVGTDFDE